MHFNPIRPGGEGGGRGGARVDLTFENFRDI